MKARLFFFAILFLSFFSCKKKQQDNPSPPVQDSGAVINPGFENNGQSSYGWLVTSASNSTDASFLASSGHSGSHSLYQKKSVAYQVQTYQDINGLENGTYKLSAYIKNSGGQNACYLFAQSGSDTQMTSLPVSGDWVLVTVKGIQVNNGKCTIGLYSDANANNWCQMDDVTFTKDDAPYTFLKGGDVSELSYIESKGGKFYEDGVQKDCFQILKDNGFNIVRLRLYNDPGNPGYAPSNRLPAGFQDTTDILNLAKRAKAAGLQILLTFHYSDYWTNAGTQTKPHDWDSLDYTQLKKAVYDFTYHFMNKMKYQNTIPQYVSLGNETSDGFLFPDGQSSDFSKMTALFNEGYDAVKAVSADTKVIIHLDDAGNSDKYDWFFSSLENAGGKYDIIGASYYPFWTNKTVAQVSDWASHESAKFNKDILIMETGYNWNATLPDGSAGQLSNNGPYQNIYPATPEGQKDFLYELFNGIKNVDGGKVIGDIYWDPVMIAVPGAGWELGAKNVVANSTLFDFNGNALPALKAFKYNN